MSGAGEALELLGGLVLDSADTWGDAAHPWQLADAEGVLGAGGPAWSYMLRARGMSKTTDVAGLALTLLVTEAPPRSRSYAYAVDRGQALLLLDSIAGFVDRTEGLAGALDVAASRVTVKATGATLDVEASDAASAFGLRPWLVVVDELAQWPSTANHRRLWSAVVSALPKVPGSRLVVLTSAGAPNHLAHEVWERAATSAHWRASVVPGPCPWWPSSEVDALRAELTPAEFRRLVLCEWAEADDALTTAEDVAACVAHPGALEPRPGVRYVASLDVGTRRDATVVVVAHTEPAPGGGRRVVVDRVMRWRGTRANPVRLDDVEAALVQLWRNYGRPPVIFDLHQAAQLTERLGARGVRCVEYVFSTAGVNRLARTLFTALRDRAIALPDDPELLAELAGVRLVETGPGLLRLDHRSGEHDDQAVAVAMCAAHLLDRPGPRPATTRSVARRRLVAPTIAGSAARARGWA